MLPHLGTEGERVRQGGPGADLESHSNLSSLTLAPSLRWTVYLSLQEGNGFCWEPTEPIQPLLPTHLLALWQRRGRELSLALHSFHEKSEENIVADPSVSSL